jgi:hypothetical protein
MESELQDDDIPEEILSIIDEIKTVCDEKRCGDVIAALGLALIGAIMTVEKCSTAEAIEHVRNDLNEIIAIHCSRH